MPAMFTRVLAAPDRSFFLLGPRATGKSTWLRERFAGATWFNLLESDLFFTLLRDRGQGHRTLATGAR
jgi:hypothetical protein